jgi:glycosyltransferase involved in cell wall biosynthesis
MTLSIIFPSYNAAETLDATVHSALEVRSGPYEVIVVDDGSTDEHGLIG